MKTQQSHKPQRSIYSCIPVYHIRSIHTKYIFIYHQTSKMKRKHNETLYHIYTCKRSRAKTKTQRNFRYHAIGALTCNGVEKLTCTTRLAWGHIKIRTAYSYHRLVCGRVEMLKCTSGLAWRLISQNIEPEPAIAYASATIRRR